MEQQEHLNIPGQHISQPQRQWLLRSRLLIWRYLPLTVKLPLTMIVLVVMAVASVTLLSLWREQQNFRAELEAQASAMLDMLTTSIDDALYNLDVDELSGIVRELNKDTNTVVFGSIYDAEGRIIADTLTSDRSFSYSGSAAVLDAEPDELGQSFIASEGTVFLWQEDQLIAGRPVTAGNRTLGAIGIGLPTTPLLAKMHAVQVQGLSVALVAVIVGTLLVLLVSRSVLRPVQEMATATQHIAQGNLHSQVPVRGSDELALLAQSFNQMVNQVRAMMERQEEQQAELKSLMHVRSDAVRAVVHDLNHTVQATQSAMDIWVMGLEYANVDMDIIAPGRDRLQAVLMQQRDLLHDMRDAALLEAGKLLLQPQETDLRELVQQTVEPLQPRYELAECNLTVVETPELPLAWCDARRMRRVIHNLLDNALRYTSSVRDDGEVQIHLAAEDTYVICAVIDNGRGIAHDQLAQLGQKFARLVRGEGAPDGMGLGLNFALGILQLSGGYLVIDSPGEGLGTIVKCYIPRADKRLR